MILSEAESLGRALAEWGHDLVYGGATPGCMGALAQGFKGVGRGKLVGVVPQMDFMDRIVEPGLNERHVVATLSGRKTVMLDQSDAFVVFPGGLGTLDEAYEAMALKSVGTLNKPIVFYNFLGIWTPTLEALEMLVEQRLIRGQLSDLITVVDNPEQLREHLNHAV